MNWNGSDNRLVANKSQCFPRWEWPQVFGFGHTRQQVLEEKWKGEQQVSGRYSNGLIRWPKNILLSLCLLHAQWRYCHHSQSLLYSTIKKKKILNGLHVAKFSLSKYKLMIFPFWLVLQQCPNSIRGYKRWEWEEEKQVEWERYTSMPHYSHLLYVDVSLSICVGLSTSQGIFHIFPGKKETLFLYSCSKITNNGPEWCTILKSPIIPHNFKYHITNNLPSLTFTKL